MAINKPIKSSFRRSWSNWIAESVPDWISAGNRKKPSYQTMAEFASKALKSIEGGVTDDDDDDDVVRGEAILRSFSSCGLVSCPTFESFEFFFRKLNFTLQELLHPSPLDISRESWRDIRRAIFDKEAIADFVETQDFSIKSKPQWYAKPNRRANRQN